MKYDFFYLIDIVKLVLVFKMKNLVIKILQDLVVNGIVNDIFFIVVVKY